MTKSIGKFRPALAATTALFLSACNLNSSLERETGAAWCAWKAGDFASAKSIAQESLADPQAIDSALTILVIVAHITGSYAEAVATFESIGLDARNNELLQEAVFESLLHLGRAPEAYAMVKEAGVENPAYRPYYLRAKLMAEFPLRVEIDRVFELPFVESEITDLFPGVAVSLNGIETTARFDTGGAFIHMSPSQAARFGVTTTDCVQSFGSLQSTNTCFGIAKKLTIGDARLANVPVTVFEVLENSPLSEIDDSIILGTNIFQQFLVTIDAPSQRFVVSERSNAESTSKHFSRLVGNRTEVPFFMWGDHFMIARGAMTMQEEANFFVDSGLVMGTPELGQAAILAPKSMGGKWQKLGDSGMSRVPGTVGLGALTQSDTLAMVVPNRTWRGFTEAMGKVQIDALLSYGFLKSYAWTIDFDRRVLVFTDVE